MSANDIQAKLANPAAAIDELKSKRLNRRGLLKTAGMVGAAAVGAGLLGDTQPEASAAAVAFGPKGHRFVVNDNDILNFALNLEYLEAEFYQRAAFGIGLPATDTSAGGASGTGTTGTVDGPTTATVGLSAPVASYFQEIAGDEKNHVEFLRSALGKHAVAEPSINLSSGVFTAAAIAAGAIPAGATFTPYAANPALGLSADASLLLGAFVFEDVGVTAYHGAAPYIRNPAYLSAAAAILAVEAYHAGEVRLQLLQLGDATPAIITVANDISALRNAASAAADGVATTDQGITLSGVDNVVPTDSHSLAFARSFAAVLNIVYLNATATPSSGGFFPNGLNGRITSLVAPAKK